MRFRCQASRGAQPGYGTATLGSVQTFACGLGYDPANPASIRYSCVGYVVSNSTDEVTRGETDQFTITIGNRPLYVYWIWGDRHVRMPVCVPEHATVKANNTEFTQSGALWLTEETVPVLETIAETGHEFLCWEGEITYSVPSQIHDAPIGTPRQVSGSPCNPVSHGARVPGRAARRGG